MTTQNQSESRGRQMRMTIVAVVALAVILVIGALLLLAGDDDDTGGGDDPDAGGPFTFSGTLNYDMPTPAAPVPNPEFAFDSDTEVTVNFEISPTWPDCGLWWRIDADDSDFFYFGGHHLDAETVEDTVELPAGNFQLQVGVSYESVDGHDCSGTADYTVDVTES